MTIEENICALRNEIPKDTVIVAASKTRTLEEIEKAYNAGLRDFGENKVQEFVEKYEKCNLDINWHFIGHLQSNKVKYLVGKNVLIHSIDSIALLNEIEKKSQALGIETNVLIQVNIAKEQRKYGFYEEELKEVLKTVEGFTNIKVKGLMTILPIESHEENRKYFRKVKDIFDEIKDINYINSEMKYLSMGMSSDYIDAVKEGTNMIRVGEAIFGKRNYNI
ncbi:YggS family pyridoxal phosphate-dependent enzyme [Clostridium cellulovorans]|uniref:Pyridoxal phosphate homeostasis protein n=1 Tax=Clostridium cellulovorans (strain ATCC 35296 / DSM 3052 / OCM 3 / 743B) TaxID=573061 RepID=D9SKK8_CLOC7|nr:YggS family pyridoxal phosphate-dependent enzyme [Clostridium cellulovorans]ADL51504.1 alanine racemase domain protein [Clostridium cellulovorans 743B]